MARTKIAVLMATYNDWDSVAELLPQVDAVLAKADAAGHVVIVDDGSTEVADKDRVTALPFTAIEKVERVELFRNQGNQRAVAVGLAYCAANLDADFVVVMDSDLEDKPEYIPQLIETCAAGQGRAIVFAERSERSESASFRFFYGVYQRLYKLLTGMSISIGNFCAIPRALVPRMANVAELWSHYPAAVMRARIPYKTIRSERGKRIHGKSKMSIVPLLLHALSGFAVHAETVGARVLVTAAAAGALVLLLVVGLIGLKLFTNLAVLGWTSVIIGLLLVLVLQIVITAVNMVFLVISVRMQPPMVPALEYAKLVMRTEVLYGKA